MVPGMGIHRGLYRIVLKVMPSLLYLRHEGRPGNALRSGLWAIKPSTTWAVNRSSKLFKKFVCPYSGKIIRAWYSRSFSRNLARVTQLSGHRLPSGVVVIGVIRRYSCLHVLRRASLRVSRTPVGRRTAMACSFFV